MLEKKDFDLEETVAMDFILAIIQMLTKMHQMEVHENSFPEDRHECKKIVERACCKVGLTMENAELSSSIIKLRQTFPEKQEKNHDKFTEKPQESSS